MRDRVGTLKATVLAAILMFVVGFGLVAAARLPWFTRSAPPRPASQTGFTHSALQPCSQRDPGGIAWVTRLNSGHSAVELKSSGVSAVPAIAGSADGLLVIVASNPNQPVDLASVRGNHAVATIARLNAQPEDPSLRSCSYKLTDNSAAAALASVGEAALASRGLVTMSQEAAAETTLILTEDPLNTQHLLVAVVLGESAPASASNPAVSRLAYVAVLDRATHRVLDTGQANWYAHP